MTEAIKADESDWLADFAEKENNNKDGNQDKKKSEWMRFDKPGQYTIRLVGKGVKFLKYFKPFGKGVRVITHKNYKDEDPAWQAGFYPNDTFAIHVIDRADGKLKILEKGKGLFKHFANYQKINEVNPAGKNGPDFVVTVEWPNGDKQLAKYTATAKAKPAPFTEQEVEMIKANLAPLRSIYKTSLLEKIKELWEALPPAAKIPVKKESKYNNASKTEDQVEAPKTQKVIEEPARETVSDVADGGDGAEGEDDLFGDKEDTSPF